MFPFTENADTSGEYFKGGHIPLRIRPVRIGDTQETVTGLRRTLRPAKTTTTTGGSDETNDL